VPPPPLTGIHHLELTVRDADRSATWYVETLGFEPVTSLDKEDHRVVMLRHGAGLLLGLVQHRATGDDDFDERRTGLDHVGFAVSDAAAVEAWAEHLDALGIARSEVKDGAMPNSRLIVFRDPDGIQLECYTSS
jgi:glyoxylase I family protein